MSDLAPFVAASIRDHVILELQKENAQLREDLEKSTTEKHEALAWDALHGNSLRIAITGPTNNAQEGGGDTAAASTNPVVYAVENIDDRGINGTTGTTGFVKMNSCTLGDLARAEIHGNGIRSGPIRDCPIEFSLVISKVDETREKFDSIEDVPAPDSDYDLGWFTVHVMSSNIGYFTFKLSTVSPDKLFDFTGWNLKDRKEYLANPKPNLEHKREVSIHDIINYFGVDTPVLFVEADVP